MSTRELPTRRYSELAHRRPGRPPGPCEVPGCEARQLAALACLSARRRALEPCPRHVYEHCHAHDYVRGVTCEPCNGAMSLIDARVLMPRSWYRRGSQRGPSRLPGLLEHWSRCPECAEGGPWSPLMIYREQREQVMRKQFRELPALLAADPARYALTVDALAFAARTQQYADDVYPTPEQLAALAHPQPIGK
jgi:hypothetical protein